MAFAPALRLGVAPFGDRAVDPHRLGARLLDLDRGKPPDGDPLGAALDATIDEKRLHTGGCDAKAEIGDEVVAIEGALACRRGRNRLERGLRE